MAMKKVLHILNSIISISLLICGILLVVFKAEEDAGFVMICGFFQIIFALVMMVVGMLFPEEPRPVSPKGRLAMRIILILSALSGHRSSLTAVHMIDDNFHIQRMWEPTIILIWGLFEVVFLSFGTYNEQGRLAAIVSVILLVLLWIGCSGWTLLRYKEEGSKKWIRIIAPILIVLLLVAGMFLYVEFKASSERRITVPDLEETRQEIEQTLEEYQADTASGVYDAESMDMTDIVTMIKEEFDCDVYYRWIDSEEDYNLVVWTDDSDDIVVYQFAKNEDRYQLLNSFVSSSMTKEDVSGREEGVIYK